MISLHVKNDCGYGYNYKSRLSQQKSVQVKWCRISWPPYAGAFRGGVFPERGDTTPWKGLRHFKFRQVPGDEVDTPFQLPPPTPLKTPALEARF